MRNPITTAVPAIIPPTMEDRTKAIVAGGNRAAHDRFMASWACLNSIEVAPPPAPPAPTENLTVAAWNIERCKRVAANAWRIGQAQADIVLATEMDLGMARSGQRHTTADLAAALGMGHAFGVEFVELGLGDAYETARHAGETNLHGLHGNALLSRWPLKNAALIPLDDGAEWYVRAPKGDGQHRVGGRMAMAAQIDLATGPLTLVSVHFESESDASGRAAQARRLLDSVDAIYGAGPCVIGGDLNTRGFLDAGVGTEEMLSDPAQTEPCFTAFAEHGFDWRASNTGATTTRPHPAAPRDTPLKTLDWLFTRGVTAKNAFVAPAICDQGLYLSDHELIGVEIAP
ncbi:hypothetical protein RGUI_2202 [Rhodovulum sp. P5]|uniref:endonuclease/exonuclease/phosphatase family protein n=1 Tax=Rhodovulum sp. P5 TaxID=1564506 RepID=UPI0009C1BA75|nr:endonuclease/exonuclease/phosphatase family protein [Rhodovulum sp. P5]ARE40343.1 hypothetical protein RGUI_2202 [Rhodovulum sp. P5]